MERRRELMLSKMVYKERDEGPKALLFYSTVLFQNNPN